MVIATTMVAIPSPMLAFHVKETYLHCIQNHSSILVDCMLI